MKDDFGQNRLPIHIMIREEGPHAPTILHTRPLPTVNEQPTAILKIATSFIPCTHC